MKIRDVLSLVFLLGVIAIFYRPVFLESKIPVPVDALVNLNYTYRDYFSKEFPRGVPYKNPLVSDPVLQQIPWRYVSMSLFSRSELPLWNPYQMAGYPLLGTVQSAPFYPLNLVFALVSFIPAWTVLIILQQILGAIFMYWYLRSRDLSEQASIFGALSFSFSGFFIAWLEWGTIAHTALWLPLGLLSIDRLRREGAIKWGFILGLCIVCSFLAGHLQTFLYGLALMTVYFIFRWLSQGKEKRVLISFIVTLGLSAVITSPIWSVQIQHIGLSARSVDLSWHKEGWFIPLAQLIQFFAPDFFGNPATGNYWGTFNYGEFIGYVGMAPLLLAGFVLIYKRSREVLFWGVLLMLAIIFASENAIAAFPYELGIPFLSSTQPTRLIFIVDVALAILGAMGLDSLLKEHKKNALKSLILLFLSIFLIYAFIFLNKSNIGINWSVTSRNLIIPSVLCVLSFGIFVTSLFLQQKKKQFLFIGLLLITAFDLLFFAGKYTPFSRSEYFYPQTKTIKFLQEQPGQFRVMTRDRSILSPNITTMYRIQSIDGYDPLYLLRFGELVSASDRGKPDISPPFGFNRIVVPTNFNTRIINLLGVKYIFSLNDIKNSDVHKVFEEGPAKVFENSQAFPRAFLVQSVIKAANKEQAIKELFNPIHDLRTKAIVEDAGDLKTLEYGDGSALIIKYTENNVVIKVSNETTAFLVLTDTYYPTWRVKIDGNESVIYRTDYNFRGVVVPSGIHTVEFKNSIL